MDQQRDLIPTQDQFFVWPPFEDGDEAVFEAPSPDPTPRIGVVLVNYKGSADTLECLESLLRSDIPLRVVVVDNESGDGSVERIVDWAAGAVPWAAPDSRLSHLTSPPLEKPVPIRVLDADVAVAEAPGEEWLAVVRAGDNLGFAGGNNLGIRHLLLDPAIEAFWLLNNDTVVEPTAARALLTTVRAEPQAGMIGTVIRFYNAPDTVQALGGMTFNPLTGASAGIHGNRPYKAPWDGRAAARQAACVLGASLTATRRFVETVGLMSEAYFLYFEEMDWALRNQGRFAIGLARGSIVYHKHGGSIGSSSKKGARSAQSEYWLLRSRLIFYRRHYPALLPLIWVQGVAQTGRRLLRRQPASFKAMTRALMFRKP
jgi:GT2 family glycosyltransferase